MSEKKRSFFATIPGLITGLAGLLTGIVGLVTVLMQLGVLGGDSDSTAPGAGTSLVPGAPSTTEVGRLTVTPTLVRFQGTQRDAEVKVTNPTTTAKVTVLAPQISGPDRSVFKADAGCTNVLLDPGRSCTVTVSFTPSGPLKSYRADLVVSGDRGTPATEVPIEASSLL
jgi:hypothetical protein